MPDNFSDCDLPASRGLIQTALEISIITPTMVVAVFLILLPDPGVPMSAASRRASSFFQSSSLKETSARDAALRKNCSNLSLSCSCIVSFEVICQYQL